MLCYWRCPHCGLRFGKRTEPVGRLYRCRRCKGVVEFVSRNRSGETLFAAKSGGPPDLMEIPRV